MKEWRFGSARIVFDPVQYTVVTHYPGEHWTGGGVVHEDYEHAKLLNMKPIQHRLVHELGHHLVAQALGYYDGCPVLYSAAHNTSLPVNADKLEWYVTAVTYYVFGRRLRHPNDEGALKELRELSVDLGSIGRALRRAVAMEVALQA